MVVCVVVVGQYPRVVDVVAVELVCQLRYQCELNGTLLRNRFHSIAYTQDRSGIEPAQAMYIQVPSYVVTYCTGESA